MDSVAAAMESRYMRCVLPDPPSIELLKTCARCGPFSSAFAKYASPCSTWPLTFIQLSAKAACICATTGPSTR
jgi:hypothetical protein